MLWVQRDIRKFFGETCHLCWLHLQYRNEALVELDITIIKTFPQWLLRRVRVKMLALIRQWHIRLPIWAIVLVMVIAKKKAREEHCVVTQAQVTSWKEKTKDDEE